MVCLRVGLLLALTAAGVLAKNTSDDTLFRQMSELQTAPRTTFLKPSYSRAQLKVGRALDPNSEQTLNVRTNNGGMATIIVKKKNRGFSSFSQPPSTAAAEQGMSEAPQQLQQVPQQIQQVKLQPASELFSTNAPPPIKYGKWSVLSEEDLRKPVYHKPSYRFASYDPKDKKAADLITSFMQHVENIESSRSISRRYTGDEGIQNDRSPVHIPVVSTRVNFDRLPIPAPVSVRSEAVFVKDEPKEPKDPKRGRFLIEIGADGVPLVHGIRVPDDEEDKRKIWRNARVINGELVPYEKGYKPKPVERFGYGRPVYAKPSKTKTSPRSLGPFTTADNFPQESQAEEESIGPFSVDDVKESVRSGDMPYMAGESRNLVQSRGGIGPFMVSDNSNTKNTDLIDYIRRINNKEGRKDYSAGRSNNMRFPDQPPIQRRMLQYSPAQNYPVSSMYSSQQNNGGNDEEASSVRTPVLQYAPSFSDLGVQPAESMPKAETKPKTKKVEYYTKNIHSDRSPYAIEPAMANPENGYQAEQTPMVKYTTIKTNKPSFDYSDDRHKPYSKNPATYPYNYGFIRRVKPERPLWVKLGDQMRDSFHSGFATVHEMARPVIDPIYEATQKISQNLGFRQPQPISKEIENKLDVVYSPATGSIIFPALGLVAGGAALGAGVVAMGRFFDLGMLKRSDEQALLDLDLEHKRALEAIHARPGENVYLVVDSATDSETSRRIKRNADNSDFYGNDKYDGQDEIHYEAIPSEEFSDIFEMASVPDRSNGLTDESVSRRRRSLGSAIDDSLGSILQDVERDVPKASKLQFEEQIKNTDWSNTPCAKKVFCEVMIQQKSDDILVMEKKMYTLFGMMHPALISHLAHHLAEVTDAIRQHDCSQFICYQGR